MEDSEKVNIDINIAGQLITLNVAFDRQDFVRDVEEEINSLFSKWQLEYPRRDERQILAMMVYRYAEYYTDLVAIHKKAMAMVETEIADVEAEISKLDKDKDGIDKR
ncbi:MAG: cell division protein ZapA [Bacteroidales bacterium]|nr:cell division protein ZapA [Bacteroidales bacterium]MDE7465202.1 cell division protein ZapA [Muribaculaceae bacterium]